MAVTIRFTKAAAKKKPKKKQSKKKALTKLNSFLKQAEPETVEFLLHDLQATGNAVTYKELRETFLGGGMTQEQFEKWQHKYSKLVTGTLKPKWEQAAALAAQEIKDQYPYFVYEPGTSAATDWIKQHGAELVTNLAQDQMDALNAMVGYFSGNTAITPDEAARMMRPCIGLTKPQAVANLHYQDAIKAAYLKQHPQAKPETLDKRAKEAGARYAARQHRYRAQSIARTELAYGYNAGAYGATKDAQNQGYIGECKKKWLTAYDERVCPICSAMDEETVDMDAMFSNGKLLPPGHPQCRCAVAYEEVDIPNSATAATGTASQQKKALLKQQVDLETQEADLQNQLANFDVKTYSGIWHNKDVTTADWQGLNIQGKKDYYQNKLLTETDPAKLQEYATYLNQVNELDLEGKAYNDILTKLQDTQAKLRDVKDEIANFGKPKKKGPFEPEAYTQARKDAAMWAKSVKEADSRIRDKCGEVWRKATKGEKQWTYEYTVSYSKYNEPLRGIEYGTSKFLGVGKVDLDDIGVGYRGYKKGEVRKQMGDITDMISKSTYDFDIWTQRGCGYNGMDKFFQIDERTLRYGTQKQLEQALLGQTVTEYGFCSSGVAKGKGFSNQPIIMNIYSPKGTQMMYVEPFSHYGAETHDRSGKKFGLNWNGIDKQTSFGDEAEMILQQGTSFRITKVEKTGSKLYVDLEVIGQQPQR